MQVKRFKNLIAVSLVTTAFLMNGCSGDDGSNGVNGTNATDSNATVKVADLTTEEWADLAPKVDPASVSVTIASPPVVKFKVTDANGKPVIGLGSTSKSATATVASYSNLSFALAKLVPATSNAPSKWISYIVTTVPTTTAALTASRPSTDNTGTLVDNGDGSYQYTFYRDITKVKDVVAGLTLTGANTAAALGDLTYDPNLTHRLTIQLSGNAPGTGSNTADAVTLTPGVAMLNPLNVIYDFIPATGKAVTATDTRRDIASPQPCFDCHTKFTVHGGGRQDVRYCVVCHTDQRKFGRTEAATTSTGFSGSTYMINGLSVGDMPTMIHAIHKGHTLSKTGYNYAGVEYNHITYPQDVRNCVKCHSNSDATPQGDNWKVKPSRLACGACHDAVNFATGLNHVGGTANSDVACTICHDSAAVVTYHVTVDPTGSNGRGGYPLNTATDTPTVGFSSGQGPSIPVVSQLNMPAGVFKIDFQIKQVTVTGAAGAKKANVTYRIMKDGLPVTLNATGNLIDNVDGTPSVYVSYAVTQDNILAPADWNKSINASVKEFRDGGVKGSQTGPDADGYYTATFSTVIPDAAKMVTGALGINYNGLVQLNHAAYPNGIRLREPKFAMKTADGQTARRSIVSNDKCNKCHGQLGISPSFHSGARNNGEGCSLGGCHDPNKATGHIGASYNFGGGWSVSSKDLIHGIHGSAKRSVAFTYEATAANPVGFGEVTYPSILKNCEACHVAGSYDFRNAASSSAVPNLLWSTAAAGNMTNDGVTNPTGIASIGLSPWVTLQTNYTGRANNLVITPIAAACFGCHDDSLAVGHMRQNGGKIYEAFGTGFNTESCLLCHGPNKLADIKAVHEF